MSDALSAYERSVLDQHKDDGNGGCIVCRIWTPGEFDDDGSELLSMMSWPCPTVRLGRAVQDDGLEPCEHVFANGLRCGGHLRPMPPDPELLEAVENVLTSDSMDPDDRLHWEHLRHLVRERRRAAPPLHDPVGSDDRAEGDIAAYAAWRRDPNRVTADDVAGGPTDD